MRFISRLGLVASAVVIGVLTVSPNALASAGTFNGSCNFSGPITPGRPITLLPVLGSEFSYAGSGVCSGMLDGAAVQSAPIIVSFRHVSTLFDTCELGPDFGLHGTVRIGSAPHADKFRVVVDLARVALVGPFAISTRGGGLGVGLAQFSPPDVSTAIQQCVSPGLAKASLAANFSTLTPLVGSR
jgi:hypothetical protein